MWPKKKMFSRILVFVFMPQVLALSTTGTRFLVKKTQQGTYLPPVQQIDTSLNIYQRCERDADCDDLEDVCACAVVGFRVCCRLHEV